MATLQESCNTGDNGEITSANGSQMICQVFTPTVNFVPTKARLFCRRNGALPDGNVAVVIRKIEPSGHPENPADYYYYVITTTASMSDSNTWTDFVFTYGTITLTAGTKYGLTFTATGLRKEGILRYTTPNAYRDSDNCLWFSSDNMATWTQYADRDLMFEIWGTSASTYSGDVEGYFVKVSGKFAPAWTDPLTSDEKVGIMGKSGGLFYPICDVDIGGHTSPTIPINGIIIKSGGVFKPKITLP